MNETYIDKIVVKRNSLGTIDTIEAYDRSGRYLCSLPCSGVTADFPYAQPGTVSFSFYANRVDFA